MLCCGYTLTDFPISIRLTSLALWQSNDCPSASKATLMNMDKYFMWIHSERFHNHNKAKQNKTVCIFLGIHCMLPPRCHQIFLQSRVLNTVYLKQHRISHHILLPANSHNLTVPQSPLFKRVYLEDTAMAMNMVWLYFIYNCDQQNCQALSSFTLISALVRL